MTNLMTAALAGLLALSTAGPAAAAGVLGGKTSTKASETIGPAAPGDPKPYGAKSPGECGGNSCLFNFGKKANKIRTIAWINCAIVTENGISVIATVLRNDFNDQVGYFSAVSRAMNGPNEFAVLEYKNPVKVAAGDTLLVYVMTSGTANGGQCTLGGTIG